VKITKYEHDPDADALYVYLSEKPYAYGEDLSPERRVDFSDDGSPIGVELTCLSRGVRLDALPAADEIGDLLAKLNIKVLV
jgi:uncharacterized protein YuzE